jgi:hypothetical protein
MSQRESTPHIMLRCQNTYPTERPKVRYCHLRIFPVQVPGINYQLNTAFVSTLFLISLTNATVVSLDKRSNTVVPYNWLNDFCMGVVRIGYCVQS